MDDAHQTPVMGTAMFNEQILRVLDPNRLFRLAQQTLETHGIVRTTRLSNPAVNKGANVENPYPLLFDSRSDGSLPSLLCW